MKTKNNIFVVWVYYASSPILVPIFFPRFAFLVITITNHLLTLISDKLAVAYSQTCQRGKRVYMEKVANSVIESLDGAQSFDREVLEGGSIPFHRCQLECLAEWTFTCKSFEYMDKRGFGDICTLSDRNYDDPEVRLVSRLGVDVYQWKCGGSLLLDCQII